ncbi:GNAT family acetyltransferase [Actinocatenispora thailandica]|uniref:GNAT family acetyltransferase n=1 Tax=Actinocatenispora thailandica TaxID=227318 RepID=A0A7R7DV02_9ACTN|nr:GNAT family N-acetyltransferase [Actinocatenispora thailandica]BCJ38349.1 GNAT family acetyltransferase [Actinocatenispora thailandica]
MPDLVIRPYRAADADAVLALAPRLTEGVAPWRDPAAVREAVRGWVADAIDGAEPVWVAVLAGRVVGFVHAGERRHFTGEADGYVGELVVAADAARSGIGRALMEAAHRWAAGRGLRRLTLETGAANATARAFYRSLGYQEEDVRLSRPLD